MGIFDKIGGALGTVVGGPLGGAIGSTLGGVVGGAVEGSGERSRINQQNALDRQRAAEEAAAIREGADQLAPFSDRGVRAGAFIDDLLGLGGGGGSAPGQPGGGAVDMNDFATEYLKTPAGQQRMQWYRQNARKLSQKYGINSPQELIQWEFQRSGGEAGNYGDFYRQYVGQREQEAAGAAGSPGLSAPEALSRFRNLIGANAQLRGAQRSAAGGLAARGLLDSSGAGNIFQSQAADIGRSSFGDFLSRLQSVQSSGQQAATTRGSLLARQPAPAQQAVAGTTTRSIGTRLFG